MQPTRYNLYTFIHKGIRRELSELLAAGGTLDFVDLPAAEAYIKRLRESLRLMNKHAHHEDLVIDPWMRGFAPHLSRRVLATHNVLEKHEAEVLTLAHTAAGNPTDGYRLYLALSRYAATQFAHMSEEETEIIAELWKHMTDEQLIAVNESIVAGIAPPDVAAYLTWMVPAVNEPERELFLDSLRKGAPPQAVAFAEELARGAREAQLAA
ncbi:MAG: hemerythrin domain-containing protein [Planctomycetes bacterium]|nr:hemerythrin domain-containing protein [Planctomycetota bacterium]MCW8134120.1 hemerythrin domain-containing protein [Planctomycetota bacterium]